LGGFADIPLMEDPAWVDTVGLTSILLAGLMCSIWFANSAVVSMPSHLQATPWQGDNNLPFPAAEKYSLRTEDNSLSEEQS
jgi:hypothetical protein